MLCVSSPKLWNFIIFVTGYDRLFKIRPIIDAIIPKYEEHYQPKQQLSVDEMTIPFKGRSNLKVYNPMVKFQYL